MNWSLNTRRLLSVTAILLPILGLFFFTAFRTGPLAPVEVTLSTVENQALAPTLFGIGTVEARHRFKIGPTRTGRLESLHVDVGDLVSKNEPLGKMEPVELGALIAAQQSKLEALSSHVAMARSRVNEAKAQQDYAARQAERTAKLVQTKAVSRDADEAATRNYLSAAASLEVSEAAVVAAIRDEAAAQASLDALIRQKEELTLLAPTDGLIVSRHIEPGSTAVAGEAVVEMIAPEQLWIHLRLNQLEADGLTAGLPARMTLRSRPRQPYQGQVLRIEPLADAVTEELLAKVVFDALPTPLPPLGELVEVEIDLPALAHTPVVPAAAIQFVKGQSGLWLAEADKAKFVAVETGRRSADGLIQILNGPIDAGHEIIVYSVDPLTSRRRLRISESVMP